MANPMMCLHQGQAAKKYTRQTTFNRTGSNTQQTQQSTSSKTKYALAFLCLFDGLRTPSIRRLVRKPRNICQNPLLTFDPSFYAPSSENSLSNIYNESIHCPCEIAVDPSVQTVLTLLRRHTSSMPPQRVVLHYFGHGCHPPTADGCLFFFSEDHAKYKPLKIQNIINACACPICVILDCPLAGVLKPHLQQKRDIFAFYACSSYELLPLSTDAPMDLFSSCLLNTLDTALRWHLRQHESIYLNQKMPDEKHKAFLKEFLDALLDAIAFDTQSPQVIEPFVRDPSIASLTRGFVLSQRVMLLFNLHPTSTPDLKPMDSHRLWEYWDLALDFSITLSEDDSKKMVFDLFITSFEKFPRSGYFPLFSFFLKIPDFHEHAANALFKYLDNTDMVSEIAARSTIPKTIIELEKPSAISMLILAKCIAIDSKSPFDQQTPIHFTSLKEKDVIMYGMVAIICAIHFASVASFNKLTQMCIDHAVDCAPFSSLLLGLLIEKAGRLMNLPPFGSKFLPLLKSPREDIRASTAFLLGSARDKLVVAPLTGLLADPSPLVRSQTIQALYQLMRVVPDKNTYDDLKKMENDPDPEVKQVYISLKPLLNQLESHQSDSFGQRPLASNLLLEKIISSVRSVNFEDRLAENIFKLE